MKISLRNILFGVCGLLAIYFVVELYGREGLLHGDSEEEQLVNAFNKGFNNVLYSGSLIRGEAKSLEKKFSKVRDAEANKTAAGILKTKRIDFLINRAYWDGHGFAYKIVGRYGREH